MSPVLLLHIIAFVAFLAALIDHPRFSAVRCIALGLALVTLVQIIGGR